MATRSTTALAVLLASSALAAWPPGACIGDRAAGARRRLPSRPPDGRSRGRRQPAGRRRRARLPGHIAAEPALVVTLDDATTPLRFYVMGEGVAGVLLGDPHGIHHCAGTDEAGTAALGLASIMSGDYALWPTLTGPDTPVAVQVLVSEMELGPDQIGTAADGLDTEAPPAAGRHALPAEGPLSLELRLSGGDWAGAVDWTCSGQIDMSRPDITITLEDTEPRSTSPPRPRSTPRSSWSIRAVPCIATTTASATTRRWRSHRHRRYLCGLGRHLRRRRGQPAVLEISREAPERTGESWDSDGGMRNSTPSPAATSRPRGTPWTSSSTRWGSARSSPSRRSTSRGRRR